MTGSAAKGAALAGMQVAPDLDSGWPASAGCGCRSNLQGSIAREQKLVNKRGDASRYLEKFSGVRSIRKL